jgi:hypothetical protein
MAILKPNNEPILHSIIKAKMQWVEKSITNITSLNYSSCSFHLGYSLDNLVTGSISGTEKRPALKPTQSNIPWVPGVSFLESKVATA